MTGPGFSAARLRRRLVSGGSWALAGKIATALSGAAISALLARLLPPEEMGAYFMILSLIGVATLLGQAGMNHAVVRLIAAALALGNTGRARAAVGATLRFGLLVSLALAAAFLLAPGHWLAAGVFHSSRVESLLGLVAIMIPVNVVQGLQAATFQGFHDMRRSTLFGGLFGACLLVLVLWSLLLLVGYARLQVVLLTTLLADLVAVGLASLYIAREIAQLKGQGGLESSELLSISWPVLVTGLAFWFLTQSDLLILGAFRSSREVALYGAASRLVLLVSLSLTVANTVLAPVISELYAQRRVFELERILRGTAGAVLVPACLFWAVFLVAGDRLLAFMYGGIYGEAATVLAILAAGYLFNVWCGSCGLALIMTGHQVAMMRVTLFSAALTVLGSLTLVQGYGGTGIALSSACGMTLQNLLMLICARRKTGIWTHARLAWPGWGALGEGGKS